MRTSTPNKSAARKQPAKSAATSPDPLDQLIWYLGRAYYTYVGLLEKLLAESGLDEHVRPGMGHILFTLFAEDDLTIKEIAERSQLANSTLTGLLNRMETAALIERRRDSSDGRLIRVRLTDLGRSLEPRCHGVVQRMDAIFQNGMGAPAVRRAKRILQRVVKIMRDAEL